LPALGDVAHLLRRSTSSGLSRSDTGEELPGSDGLHVYVAVQNGTDIERFLRVLHALTPATSTRWAIPRDILHALPSLFTEPSAANEIRLVRIPPDLANKVISVTLSAGFPEPESVSKPFDLVSVPPGRFPFVTIACLGSDSDAGDIAIAMRARTTCSQIRGKRFAVDADRTLARKGRKALRTDSALPGIACDSAHCTPPARSSKRASRGTSRRLRTLIVRRPPVEIRT
jgi:hypothetical protein